MRIAETHSQLRQHEDQQTGFEWNEGDIYEVLVCPACDGITFRRYYWHDAKMDYDDIEHEVLYPSAAKELLGLPPAVKAGHEAAVRVRAVDANAYAVLIGRVLELVCHDRAATGRSLNEKLGDLAKRGEIPKNLVSCARHLRNMRNVGAHASVGDLTSAEVPILDDLLRSLLEYVYTAPYLAQRAEERLASVKHPRHTASSRQNNPPPATKNPGA